VQHPKNPSLAIFHDNTYHVAVVNLNKFIVAQDMATCTVEQDERFLLQDAHFRTAINGNPVFTLANVLYDLMVIADNDTTVTCRISTASIWADLWASTAIVARRYGTEEFTTYDKVLVTVTPPPARPVEDPVVFWRCSMPLGFWMESLYTSPSSWLQDTFRSDNHGNPQTTYVGSRSMFGIMNNKYYIEKGGIGQSIDYDVLRPNTSGLVGPSWLALLQAELDDLVVQHNLVYWSHIKGNRTVRDIFMHRWAQIIRKYALPHAPRSSWTHPTTGSLWALRSDGLFEISKSGVQVQRADGKCMPSGVALCPPCWWAPAGAKCQPCPGGTEWAAHVLCYGCSTNSTNRRLLQQKGLPVRLEAQLSGSGAIKDSPACNLPGAWTNLSNNGIWSIQFYSQDPAACIRQLTAELTKAYVIIRPHVSVPLPPPAKRNLTVSPPAAEQAASPVVLIAVLSTLGGLLLLGLILASLYYYFTHHHPLTAINSPPPPPVNHNHHLFTAGQHPLLAPMHRHHVSLGAHQHPEKQRIHQAKAI
jgi:hypothetical protein